MQLVAPRAVRIAVAMLATSCTTHFRVSFLVIAYLLPYYWFYALPEFSGRCLLARRLNRQCRRLCRRCCRPALNLNRTLNQCSP